VIADPITESMRDPNHSLQEGTGMSLVTQQSGATDPEHDPPTEPAVDGRQLRAVRALHKQAGSGGLNRTPEGKAKSSKNATKVGIFSKSPVVGDERPEDWEALRQGLWDSFQPFGYLEEMLVDEMALNRQQKARLNRFMDGIVQHQFDALNHFDRDTHLACYLNLPLDEAAWFVSDPESALECLDALEKDGTETALEIYQVEPLLLALSIACGLDPTFRWPNVPEGQEVGDVEGWNVGLVRQCLEAAAAQRKQEPERVIKEARAEAEAAGFRQYLRRQAIEHREKLRAAQALLPADRELEKIMRYGTYLDKEYERLTRHLENSQRARANSLPPSIRIDIQEA
jgi:hypothetical protein